MKIIQPLVQQRAITYYSWIDWIISENLPLNFTESSTNRRYTNLPPISKNTLMNYIFKLTTKVEEEISTLLPVKFGIVFDAWQDARSYYYIAMYAAFPIDHHMEYVLLAMQPPLETASFTASAHVDLIESTLELYGKDLQSIAYIVGDNCATNGAIADQLDVPILGCNSHRLNLGVKLLLNQHENLLSKIDLLMKKISTKKRMSKLRELTPLSPKIRMPTRWSADFEMLKRYRQLKPFIDALAPTELEILPLLLSAQQFNQVESLIQSLKKVQEVSFKLQEEPPPDLGLVRMMFDLLLEDFPAMASKIGAESDLIHSPSFEKAIIKIIEEEPLNQQEVDLVEFLKINFNDENEEIEEEDIIQRAVNKYHKKMKRTDIYDVEHAKLIPTTSNIVERLFSKTSHVLTFERQSMHPATLEALLFLKENKNYWDVVTVNKILVEN